MASTHSHAQLLIKTHRLSGLPWEFLLSPDRVPSPLTPSHHGAALPSSPREGGKRCTVKRLPPTPVKEGITAPSSATPSPPRRGEALLHSSGAPLRWPSVSTEIEWV